MVGYDREKKETSQTGKTHEEKKMARDEKYAIVTD